MRLRPRFLEDFKANLRDSSAGVQFIASRRNDDLWMRYPCFSTFEAVCAAARVHNCQIKGCCCCNSKIPSRAGFSRCVGGCDGAWLENWFKLIPNSMPLMSVVLLAVCECQMRVTKTISAVLRPYAHDDWKSIHNCSIISTNCQNTMDRTSLRSQNYLLFVTLTTLAAAAFRIGRCKKLSSILCDFFRRSLLFGRACWYCQKDF